MTEYTTYFKGECIPDSQVTIDTSDRGFLVGDVVFDVARTYEGKSPRLLYHVDRPLKHASSDPGLSSEEVLDISDEVALGK